MGEILVKQNVKGSVGGVLNEKSILEHKRNLNNPHSVTKEQLGIFVDSEPYEGSENLITSGAVYNSLGDIETALDSILATQEALIGGE